MPAANGGGMGADGDAGHRREVERLRAVMGSDAEVYRVLQYQFGVLFQRTQTIFTLGGLALTVTGFSGHRLVAGGAASALPLALGLALIVSALALALYGVARIRFLSSYGESGDRDGRPDFAAMLAQRDRKAKLFNCALGLLVAGWGLYSLGLAHYLFRMARFPAPQGG